MRDALAAWLSDQVGLPVAVHDLADAAYPLLEHAMRAGIGDHQRRKPVGVLRRLGLQVLQVHVAVPVAADDHDAVAGHDGAGRVGAVRA